MAGIVIYKNNKQNRWKPLRVHLFWLLPGREIGLGGLIKWIIGKLGLQTCEPCARRAQFLDHLVLFEGGAIRQKISENSVHQTIYKWFFPKSARLLMRSGTDPCLHYHGSCTGFGNRQCITAPSSLDPAAGTIEQCCDGWFQYPWIEICPGEEARKGCGICFW